MTIDDQQLDSLRRIGRIVAEVLQRMASIIFSGPDLCTVYVDSRVGISLPTFRSPIPGRALPLWNASCAS